MNPLAVATTCLCFVAVPSQNAVGESAKSAAVFDVGSRSQLFVDRALVARADGVSFHLVPATKHPAGLSA